MKNNRLKLVYWDAPNFGDILCPYIVQSLSGLPVVRKYPYTFHDFRGVCYHLLHGHLSVFQKMRMPWDSTIVAVGSILWTSNSRSKVWGAGFMNEREHFHGGRIYALRGGVSLNKLKAAGVSCGNPVLGDPALLLPLLLEPAADKDCTVGIIPHWRETDYFKQHYGDRYKVIDLRTRDIEDCVRQITSCQFILSTSLHGLIVPHAYGIPALHIKHGYIDTDGFKFRDYYSSVGITYYEGFTNFDQLLALSPADLQAFFAKHSHRSLPQNDLARIQRDLLRAAPFPLIDKYRAIANS